MVAEVVLSVMGNRSDRRFANLSNSRALEAVEPIRARRADFHQGPGHSNKAPYRGRIYDSNRLRLTPTKGLALVSRPPNNFTIPTFHLRLYLNEINGVIARSQ